MNKNKKQYRYIDDDAYIYANVSNDCEIIRLVIVLSTVFIIGFILYNTLF